MNVESKRRSGVLVVLLCAAVLTAGTGCSALPPPLPGFPEGDPAARRKTKKLAVAGFLVHYSLGPDMNLSTVFNRGTRYQLMVESAFANFADELGRSPYFKTMLASKVKGNSYYRDMKIDPDPRSRLRSTCPEGYRKLGPGDQYDYRGLCRALGVGGIVLFEFSYSMLSAVFTRAARIHSANLLVLGEDGTILYRRSSFSQISGGQYFAEYAWLRRRSVEQDLYCLDMAVRSIAGDLVVSFAPR